ncbi:hypothetical protein RRV45_15875 [Bacillus sp. DTU_2020_1000418_1_SI_GHA_SEK_038]|uniref:F510_1955 family glycosylhydrolase n=1 Tax=Bacillus sp. DTU_2020_1000418_1_SI_GHA_SEK_038 TaxID=3077585 RepID=UPI0028E9DDBE|nr:hypothetical protein [Bacillus sp. DTU_2020_1000418_1_SI_GHA_SEK_038]WNS74380.1 hypothetical protein RRV45_15875 [Bacillus sp. DTU_2020_1000418_1_SI_GHA_SEK_038]
MTISIRIKKHLTFLAFGFAIVASGCSADEQKHPLKKEEPVVSGTFELKKAAPQRLEQIYGLGYPGNDTGLYIASHEGLKVYSNGGWLEGTSQKHEYMGFQATEDGFMASGHPEKGSDLKDPLGLVYSQDKGATLENLAFYSESNFYFLSVSYNGKVIYIINQEKNSQIEPGVFISKNEGKTWEQVQLNGLDADTLGMIAAHPTNNSLMAMSTKSGIFFSNDQGKNMNKFTDPIMSTALAFSEDNLYYSSVENNKVLFYKMNIHTLEAEQISIPFLSYDNPITFISVNYKDQNTLSFATYLNDVYESSDGGQNWKLVLKNGRIE